MHQRLLLASLSLATFSLFATTTNADTLPRNSWVPDGLLARVQDSAFQLAADELEVSLGDDLEETLYAIHDVEIYNEGCMFSYTANIDHVTNVSFAPPSLWIDSRPNAIYASFEITDFDMQFVLDGLGAFCLDYYDCDSAIHIDRLFAEGEGQIDVVNGHAHTTMNWANAQIDGYSYDTGLWCFIIDIIADILQEDIESTLEATINDFIMTDVPEALDSYLAQLELDETFTVFDLPFTMQAVPDAVDENNSGVTLAEATRLGAISAPCGPQVNEFRYTPSSPPNFGFTVPGTGDAYDFAVALSDDVLNQVLYTSFDSGALCIVLDENSEQKYGIPWDVTTTDLALFFPELYAIAPDAPTKIELVPRLAPYVTIGQNSGLLAGQLEVFLQETQLTLSVEIDGVWEVALVAAVTADAEFSVRVQPDGTLRLLMSDLFYSTIEIEEEPLVDLNDLMIEQVIPFLMLQIVPLVFSTLDTVQLPVIYGYEITPVAIITDGPAEDYMSFYATLSVKP